MQIDVNNFFVALVVPEIYTKKHKFQNHCYSLHIIEALCKILQLTHNDSNFLIRQLSGTEQTDHSFENDNMMLIWAIGQSQGEYVHRPDSGLEKGTASVTDFYRPDEVKYHGKDNRGFTMVNFFGNMTFIYLCHAFSLRIQSSKSKKPSIFDLDGKVNFTKYFEK